MYQIKQINLQYMSLTDEGASAEQVVHISAKFTLHFVMNVMMAMIMKMVMMVMMMIMVMLQPKLIDWQIPACLILPLSHITLDFFTYFLCFLTRLACQGLANPETS